MAKLEINNVSKTYNANKPNSVEAVRDVSCELDEGEFFSVIGPTGCGKSTLMKMVAGLIEPTEGEITLDGESITGPREDIGVVFQEDSTFPWRSTLENVEFGLEMRGVGKQERRDRAHDILELVGLSGFEDNYPSELSGGMRQRVAIARTLALNPDLMLMDEPFGALDEQTRLILGGELLRICQETNQTTMFITHSITEAAFLSDRVFVMSARPGEIKELVEVDIERPRDESIMTSDRFNEITDDLWEALKSEAQIGFEQSMTVD
ncbi:MULTISPECIES: ABC transporter ATP-binding protein [Natrialba]|uniref:ABC transporter ATP-binding protein n=1 Tax=Natrialba swarupiae TaxID=2448032 RepID=A0A5D5AL70_9EURY|nr:MULTISPECIES: ABC transporter ATP-binding protein [Natrialba]MWV38479.1 ATP-binding cassette domain-containing protein [Natrialba sp. INN-245]TYT62618.1 ABC transporter ATP-binding protein [Natrialba swarupiae]